jgi:hypothetical protein
MRILHEMEQAVKNSQRSPIPLFAALRLAAQPAAWLEFFR